MAPRPTHVRLWSRDMTSRIRYNLASSRYRMRSILTAALLLGLLWYVKGELRFSMLARNDLAAFSHTSTLFNYQYNADSCIVVVHDDIQLLRLRVFNKPDSHLQLLNANATQSVDEDAAAAIAAIHVDDRPLPPLSNPQVDGDIHTSPLESESETDTEIDSHSNTNHDTQPQPPKAEDATPAKPPPNDANSPPSPPPEKPAAEPVHEPQIVKPPPGIEVPKPAQPEEPPLSGEASSEDHRVSDSGSKPKPADVDADEKLPTKPNAQPNPAPDGDGNGNLDSNIGPFAHISKTYPEPFVHPTFPPNPNSSDSSPHKDIPPYMLPVPANVRRANATFYMLCRNSDLEGALMSIKHIEERFNWRYGYPWVFLNDEEWDEEFIR
jgi:hypothetical protein